MSTPRQTYPKIYDEEVIQRSVRETARLERIYKEIEKEKTRIALFFIKKGFDNDFVSEVTELTTEQIEEIRKEPDKP